MITLVSPSPIPVHIYAGETFALKLATNRSGRIYLHIYSSDASFVPQYRATVSAPIVGGLSQFDLADIIEQYAHSHTFPLINISRAVSEFPNPVFTDYVPIVEFRASDSSASLHSPSVRSIMQAMILPARKSAPSGQMFLSVGEPDMLRGAWAVGNIAPQALASTIRIIAIRDGGYTDMLGGDMYHIDPSYMSGYAVNLIEDPYWREAHTLDVSAILPSGQVYRSLQIPLRIRRLGDRQAYFRNEYGAFQPIVLHSTDESVTVKFASADMPYFGAKARTEGAGMKHIPYTTQLNHSIKCYAGYYEHTGSASVCALAHSDEIYIHDYNNIRRLVHSDKTSAGRISMNDAVLSAKFTLIDYYHNNIISPSSLYDNY